MTPRRIVIEPVTPRAELTPVLAEPEVQHEDRGPALRILVVMLVALLSAGVLDSAALRGSARSHAPGAAKDLLTAVAAPVDEVASAARLDVPRRLADEALGRTTTSASDRTGSFAQAPVVTAPLPSTPPTTLAPAPPSPVTIGAHRSIEQVHPLKVWITGDSDIDYLGKTLLDEAAPLRTLASAKSVDVHVGTGLTRPDVFDWLAYARKESPRRTADAVLITLGGNDAQGIPDGPGRAVQPGDLRWRQLYAERIILVARELSLGGTRPVYWVTLPPARSPRINRAFFEIDGALRYAAGQVPGMVLIDALPVLSDSGRYSAYLTGSGGDKVLVRQSDGIHPTFDGSRRVAAVVLARLKADWGL
jgi:hypothetical protein